MATEELERRIQILEDIESIKKLKAKYCYYADTGQFDELIALFAETAKLELGPIGAFEGKAVIDGFFRQGMKEDISFSMHTLHNPIIKVKGEQATGEWYFFLPATHTKTNRAIWMAGKYEEEYVKEAEEWKFSLIKVIFKFRTPYDEGWVKTPMMP